MIFMTKTQEIAYWTEKLAELEVLSTPLLNEYNTNFKLSYEKTYELMSYVQHYATYTRLLVAAHAREDDPKPKFWKRFKK